MKRAFPWIIATLALVAFGASFSELQRMRGRFGEITRIQDRHPADYTEFLIRAQLAETKGAILIVGDSITARAKFPTHIAGRPIINGGIGGATIEDFEGIAARLAGNPSLIVIALGTNNDADSIRSSYPRLLGVLKEKSARLLAVGVTPQAGAAAKNMALKQAADRAGVRFIEVSMPEGGTLSDRIHLSDAGYRTWTPAIATAILERTAAAK